MLTRREAHWDVDHQRLVCTVRQGALLVRSVRSLRRVTRICLRSVKVRSAAMGRSSDKKVEMVYYWGHNGQASVLASDSPVAKPEEMTIAPGLAAG